MNDSTLCIHIYIYLSISMCIYIYIHIYIYTFTERNIEWYTYIYIYCSISYRYYSIYIYIHRYTHTHNMQYLHLYIYIASEKAVDKGKHTYRLTNTWCLQLLHTGQNWSTNPKNCFAYCNSIPNTQPALFVGDCVVDLCDMMILI